MKQGRLYRRCSGLLGYLCGVAIVAGGSANAATYFVSPRGDDTADGQSTEHPWKTCHQVEHAELRPGDTIEFQRGGEWRERLEATADGVAGMPITYDAYGEGAKPRFLGSDVLPNGDFKPAGANQYSCPLSVSADSALQDHVFIPSTFSGGAITITTVNSDPRTDGKLYTACTRGNVIFSARKNHLIFRNLIVDETAGQLNDGPNQGYGVRIEGSTDVLVEYCEAYRCGRHNFAAINSTGFVGRHLMAAYVVPNMPGGNTAYVSYADTGAPVAACIHEWDDISANHMEDGKGGVNMMFVSHGDHQGSITIDVATSDTKMSFMSAPIVLKNLTIKANGSIENFGNGAMIDGVRLLDSAAIDQYGSGGTIQNCVAALTPAGAGATGYGTAIVCRDKAKQNVIRFNTLVTKKFTPLCLAGADAAVKWYGNIAISDGAVINKTSGKITTNDIAMADYNFYSPAATFSGDDLTTWKANGFDQHALSGDPQFVNSAAGDFSLLPGSPCINAAKDATVDAPKLDAAGRMRGGEIGAYNGSAKPADR